MSTDIVAVIIAGAALFINIIVVLENNRRFSASQQQAVDRRLSKEINQIENTIRAADDDMLNKMGESLAALREKMTGIEKWTMNEFVRREDFYRILDGINANLEKITAMIESKQARTESLIERLRSERPGGGYTG